MPPFSCVPGSEAPGLPHQYSGCQYDENDAPTHDHLHQLVGLWRELLACSDDRKEEIVRSIASDCQQSNQQLRVFTAPPKINHPRGRRQMEWYVDENGETPDSQCISFATYLANYIASIRAFLSKNAVVPGA